MSDATRDLNKRLNNIEESVDLLQQQVELITETLERAIPEIMSRIPNNKRESEDS